MLLLAPAASAAMADPAPDPYASVKALYRRIEAEVDPKLSDGDYLGAVAASGEFVKQERDVGALGFLLDLRSSYLAAAGEDGAARLSMARYRGVAAPMSPAREYDEKAWAAARAQVRWETPEDVLRRAAAAHSVIMISEAHHVPETRAFGARMLELLKGLGFEYLAMEGLRFPVPPDAVRVRRSTATDAVSGYYMMEPQMAGLVREARRLGFKLVAYEDETTGGGDREEIQGRNLYERVLKARPDAKVVVWAGYGHVYKRSPYPNQKLMAQWVWELTGREPFCLYQVEDARDPLGADRAFYKPLVLDDAKRPRRALVLINRKGLFPALDAIADNGLDRRDDGAAVVDGYVVHPPFSPRAAGSLRPAWIAREGLRRVDGMLDGEPGEAVMAQAFPAEEGVGSVPADQFVVDSSGRFELWLRPGRYILRIRDAHGRVRLETPGEVPASGAAALSLRLPVLPAYKPR